MPVLTPLQAANEAAKLALGPAIPFLMRLPLPAGVKADLMVRPVDAFLNLFRPVEDFFAEVVSRATQYVIGDSGGDVFAHLPMGMTGDLRVDGVPGDNQLMPSTRDLVRRLRTIAVFSAHVVLHPLRLGQAFKEVCVLRGMQNIAWVGDWIQSKVATPPVLREGPLHRAWRALPRNPLPEPPYLMGLGVVVADDVAALTIAGNVLVKAIDAASAVTVASISTAGTVTVALFRAIVDIRNAELHALETQISADREVEITRITGTRGEPLPGQPGYQAPAAEGIPGWMIGAGVLIGIALLRR